MFSFRTTPLEEQEDLVLGRGRVGVLCNHVAWNPDKGEYLFETLYKKGNLKKIFVPNDGLFCEIHEEYGGVDYSFLTDCDFIHLSKDTNNAFSKELDNLKSIDCLIIELQDVGVRYCDYTSLLYNLFQIIHNEELELSIYILDRENPTGRQVEGTMLPLEFSSSEGVGGLPHRHGLTFGELANLFHSELGAKFSLHIISYFARSVTKYLMPWSITPKYGISGLFSATFFAGQYLLSATNLSFGEGTEKTFEIFGAPFLENLYRYSGNIDNVKENEVKEKTNTQIEGLISEFYKVAGNNGAFMRWINFVPRFGKFKGEKCFGFHLIPRPGIQYHSLSHTLKILRFLNEIYPDLEFMEEMDANGLTQFDYILGDQILQGYINLEIEWDEVKEHIKIEEQKWIRKAKRYLLYDEIPWRVKSI